MYKTNQGEVCSEEGTGESWVLESIRQGGDLKSTALYFNQKPLLNLKINRAATAEIRTRGWVQKKNQFLKN